MKKITAKVFIMVTALMVFLAGCNNLFDNSINDDDKDGGTGSSSKTVTLKGSLAVEGDAVPSGILAMVGGVTERSAVTGGSMLDGYSFAFEVIDDADRNNKVPAVFSETDKKDFTLELEDGNSYTIGQFSVKNADGKASNLDARYEFNGTECRTIDLSSLTGTEANTLNVFIVPTTDTVGDAPGKIALEIKTSVPDVKYVGYSFVKSDNPAYSGSGTEAFGAGSKATINVTEGAEKGEDPTPIANGVYDFEFKFYATNPNESTATAPTPLAVAYQKVNVFAGFVTDTWISDGSAYFKVDAGKQDEFTVTQAAIEAYKNPKEFYVKGDGSDGSWGDAGDGNSGTSIRRPFATLQQAIDRIIGTATEPGINDTTSEYTIYVKDTVLPKGEVIGTDSNGYAIYAYKMADFTVLGTTALKLTIVGVGNDATLSGKKGNDNCGSVIRVETVPGLKLTLKNLTIKDGNEGGVYISKDRGGEGATVTIESCTISGNIGSAGIYNYGGTVTLKNCKIENNKASSGSGVNCSDGKIIIDETSITSNKDDNDQLDKGIKLENSTLTIKNTLTLGNSILVIGGESTIVNDDGNDAVIKRDESVNANDFAFVCVDSNATLNLKGKGGNALIFDGFSDDKGIWLNETTSFLKLDGEITGSSGKPLDVYVKNSIGFITGTANTYLPITLGSDYSNDSKIFVKLKGINNISSDVLISNCNENAAKTFDVVCEPSSGGSESYTVTPAGKLKFAVFTQAEFISYCSELYESGDYANKMTLDIPSGSSVGKVNLQYIEGMQSNILGTNIEMTNVWDAYKYVKTLVIPDGYKTITSSYTAQGLFYGNSYLCENLEEITLPSTMESIGDYVFNRCVNLKKVTINGDVESIGSYAFANCHSLEEIELPTGLKSIGENSFYRTGLTSIEIPDGVEELPTSAFEGTYSLANIKLPKNLKKLGQSALGGQYLDSGENVNEVNTVLTSIELPEGLEEIGESAFSYQRGLTSITIPSSVTEIKNYVFTECTALETVIMLKETPPTLGQYNVFPSSVKAILVPSEAAKTAYTNATNWSNYKDKICVRFTKEKLEADLASKGETLGSVEYYTMPTGYGVIMPNTFSDCENLKGVVIPADVVKIEADAFNGCKELASVTLTRYNENSGSIITSIVSTKDEPSKPDSFNGCTKLAAVYVPDMSNDPAGTLNTTYSNGWANTNYQGKLKSSTLSPITFVEISKNLTANVTSIEIPFGYTVINTYDDDDENSVFSAYPKLETITLPETVVKISSSAFKECTVSSLTIKAQTPPTLGNTNPLTPTRRNKPVTIAILVPESAVETYKNECESSGTWYNKANANQIYAIGEIPATSIKTKTNSIRIGVNESFDLMGIITIEPSNYTKNKLNITVKNENNGEYLNAVDDTKVQNLTDMAKGTITVTLGHHSPIDISFICYASEVLDADVLTSIQGPNTETLTIPYGFTSIEGTDQKSVFENYTSLHTITIPETVTSMNAYMGFGSNITTITMNCLPPSIEEGTFNGLTSSNGNTNLFVPKAYETEYNQWYSYNSLSDKFKLNFE